MGELAQLLADGLIAGSVIAISAVGLTLVMGLLRITNFAHAELITFGALITFSFNVGLGLNLVLAAAAAVVVVAALAVGLEFALWRPLRRRRSGSLSLLLTSVGLSIVMRQAAYLIWGAQQRRFAINPYSTVVLGPIRLGAAELPVIGVTTVAIVLVSLGLAYTRTGKATRALAEDPQLASVAGIDIDRLTIVVWIVAAGLAGLAGVMQGMVQLGFTPELGARMLLPIFAAVILGGVGNAYGSLIAGLLLGIAMQVSTWSGFAGGVPAAYTPVVAFVLLVVALLFRPYGIVGKRALA